MTPFSSCFLFQNLSEDDYALLQKASYLREFRAGELIFRKGEKASFLALLTKGKVKLCNTRKGSGKEEIVCVIEPVGFFCLAPLLQRQDFHINSIAITPGEIRCIPKNFIFDLIERSHAFSKNVISCLAEKECDLCEEVCDLSLRTTKERLAGYLLSLADHTPGKSSLSLGLNQGQLASYLGTVRETLSRDLKSLKKARIIDLKRDSIMILNRSELSQIATSAEKSKSLPMAL